MLSELNTKPSVIMIKATQICIFLGLSFSTLAQENTVLFDNGKLKADTSLFLNSYGLTIWAKIEEEVLSNFINYFEPPAIAIDANISISGVVFFQYDNNTEKFKLLKFHTGYDSILTSVLFLFEEALAKAVSFAPSRSTKKLLNNQLDDGLTFYLPIDFKVQLAQNFVNSQGEISLRKSRLPLIKPD